MFQPPRFRFSGEAQKDSLDIFKEKYNQPSEYSAPDYLLRKTPSQFPERQNVNASYQPRGTKGSYAQELEDQIREQSIRKRNQEENRKREEQYLLRQSLDNYPFGRDDLQSYNVRRGGGLQKLYASPPQKPISVSPQPQSDFPSYGIQNRKNYEKPVNPFERLPNGLDSPFKKLLDKPYSIEPLNPNDPGNYIFGSKKSDGEKVKDKREKMKEEWMKDLSEQRAQLAKRKEEEKRKMKEEEQLLEEKLKAQQAEISRAMMLEQEKEIRLFAPPGKKEEVSKVNSQSLDLPVKKEISEENPNPVRSQEFKSFDPNNAFKYEPSVVKKQVAPSQFKTASAINSVLDGEAENNNGDTVQLHNRVDMLREEILSGKKMFSQQMRYLNEKFNLNSEKPSNVGKLTELPLYDGKTGTIAESGVYLYEMQQNVNTKFVIGAVASYADSSKRKNKTPHYTEEENRNNLEHDGSQNQYKGSFDSDDKGMQTIELEALSKEIEKYTTQQNNKYQPPTKLRHNEEGDPIQHVQQEVIQPRQIQDEHQPEEYTENTRNIPEPYDYFQKIEEILKDFRQNS